MSKIQITLGREATSETASVGTSNQPSLTFSELLEKAFYAGSAVRDDGSYGDYHSQVVDVDDLKPILARLEALAAEWEARAGQLPVMGYASDHNRGEVRGLEDAAEELRAILRRFSYKDMPRL